MGSFLLGKVYENCPKIKNKCYFTKLNETYFEESNIDRKPPIWAQDNIITKFGKKKNWLVWFGKEYENCTKIKEKFYFTKFLRRV